MVWQQTLQRTHLLSFRMLTHSFLVTWLVGCPPPKKPIITGSLAHTFILRVVLICVAEPKNINWKKSSQECLLEKSSSQTKEYLLKLSLRKLGSEITCQSLFKKMYKRCLVTSIYLGLEELAINLNIYNHVSYLRIYTSSYCLRP